MAQLVRACDCYVTISQGREFKPLWGSVFLLDRTDLNVMIVGRELRCSFISPTMQAEVQQFSAFLQSLNLTAGLFKPTPGPPLLSTLGNGSSFNPFGVLDNTSIASSDPLDFNAQENCSPEPYSAPPFDNQEFSPFDSAKAAIFRYRQQQSVNLGSWLVTELWSFSISE
jgi:hypothetical protein